MSRIIEYQDKLGNEQDWKDGMNAFRTKIQEKIQTIYNDIDEIKHKLGYLNMIIEREFDK